MTVHFTSDQHYYHKNILKFQYNRGRRWDTIEEMNRGLVKLHNSVVQPDDTVFMLGDFAFADVGTIKGLLNSLNGKKVLILGNHDRGLRKGSKSLVDEGYVEAIYAGYHETKIGKTLVCLNHYSQRVWNKSHYGSYHLFGHSHGSMNGVGRSVDVGVDSQEMAEFTGDELRPWSQYEIDEFLGSQTIEFTDHHDRETT